MPGSRVPVFEKEITLPNAGEVVLSMRANAPGTAWSRAQAEAATDFRQEEPNEGQPATERTEVRILFDDRNLYIGIRAFDSDALLDPDAIAQSYVDILRQPRSAWTSIRRPHFIARDDRFPTSTSR